MEQKHSLTAAQAEAEMNCFRRVFGVVRLLQEDQIAGLCRREPDGETCPCYTFWERDEPCEYCASARAFLSRQDEAKLEFFREGVYQVIARYLEVDGKPCVMELLREFRAEDLLDLSGEEKLLSHIHGYYEKTYTDVMTGIYNRRFYEEKLRNSTLSSGVAMIDLDDFKVYNDVYGHSAGDAVLVAFAESVRKNIRVSDKLVRYGGDEFLLIMPGVSESGFEAALRHILQNINSIVLPGYEAIRLTTSIGATMCAGEPVMDAVHRADRLLYKAKLHKNIIVTDKDREIPDTGSKKTVLIVDDAEINREILASILSNEFTILEAADGRACIRALQKYGEQISVVLLDIMMPEMDGFDVLAYMQEHRLIENIPVITITSDDSRADDPPGV